MELAYLFGNPNITITGIITLITCVLSYYAEENPLYKVRWMFNPGKIRRSGQYDRWVMHGFIHSGYMHLGFNMMAFYSFGTNVEYTFITLFGDLGGLIFLLFYISAIAIASLPSYFKYQHTDLYNALGASGAVSAIVFAAILFNPLGGVGVIFIPVYVPGFIFGLIYLAYSQYMSQNSNDNIGHDAHFFGALYGIVFCVVLYPKVIWQFFEQIALWKGFL